MSDPAPPRPRLNAGLVLKRLAIVVPTSLLIAALIAEALLRFAEADPAPLFVHDKGRVHIAPAHDGFVPVDAAEVPDRLRIVCMGASTIVGVPYEPELSPPRWLELVLARRGVKAEVITIAAPGLASRHLLSFLPDVLELHPDALVLATGHNEYLEATRLLGEHWWEHLRLWRFVENWIDVTPPADDLMPTPGHGFDQAEVAETFRRNIREIQALADGAGVPLLLCEEVCNLADFPPVLGDDPAADEDADTAFARGQALLAAGDKAGALAALQRARDLDRWPHRASSALNEAVRAEAHHFVALGRLFAEQSARGVPGFELFADHCHPTPAGQRLMALGVADALEDLKLFPLTGKRGTAPPLDAGLRHFGADAATFARADAQIGRAFTGFALMRGAPGALSQAARRSLESARSVSEGRAGEVLGSLALLDLLDGDRVGAYQHIEACRAASPAAINKLQRLYDGYPWVRAVFDRNGVMLRQGNLRAAAP